jgi:hypothetical protein
VSENRTGIIEQQIEKNQARNQLFCTISQSRLQGVELLAKANSFYDEHALVESIGDMVI